ncbi:hypothetical protein ASD45_08435 [Pseudolabrys sp. Root1462]|uniref:hypothetical protein n=1 Tax=Pseudolabrys sp. Root1462 TaxID=1736466 RepID=UPI0007039E47|nr:hypothetical protein [Pseudolabrys sp. Root1462]KQZ00880.1 hypothetical protein ASD45_08435 [Pseudolabrys sp. Root1462]
MKDTIIATAQFIGIMAIPVGILVIVMLRYWNNRLNRADESDVTGINAIPAEWPADSLSREFEQEPRGM